MNKQEKLQFPKLTSLYLHHIHHACFRRRVRAGFDDHQPSVGHMLPGAQFQGLEHSLVRALNDNVNCPSSKGCPYHHAGCPYHHACCQI